MMFKRYILTSLLAAGMAAAFSFGTTSDAYADSDKNRIRTDLYRVDNDWNERKNDDRQTNNRQDDDSRDDDGPIVTRVVPVNGNGTNGSHAVPEPATMLLIGSALGGLALVSRRRNRE